MIIIYQINSLADYADKPKTTLTIICLSLRNNAARCIPLRYLRYLRENTHISVLKQSARISEIRRGWNWNGSQM